MSRASRTKSGLRHLFRSRSGSTAIEFAILAMPFLLVVFAIFEIALLFTAELVLDKGTAYAGRMIRVGKVQQDSMTRDQFAALTCDQVKILLDCNKLVFDVRSYPSFDDVPSNVPMSGDDVDSSQFQFNPGRGGTIVSLRTFYEWPILTDVLRQFFAKTKDGSVILMSMSTFRTEPF